MMPLTSFHAHVYFEPAQLESAADLRGEIGRLFGLEIGRVHRAAVGPHTRGMFQVRFGREMFGAFVPWLMQHRRGLSVLIHAESGDDYRDHTDHAIWLGSPVTLDLSIFAPEAGGISLP